MCSRSWTFFGGGCIQVPGGKNLNNFANVELIVNLARRSAADAVWAGWGHAVRHLTGRGKGLYPHTKVCAFWRSRDAPCLVSCSTQSENPRLPESLEAQGIVFLGPPARPMRLLGDKIISTILAQSAGVQVCLPLSLSLSLQFL